MGDLLGDLIAVKGEEKEVREWYKHIFKREPEWVKKVTERLWLLGYVCPSEIRRLEEEMSERKKDKVENGDIFRKF